MAVYAYIDVSQKQEYIYKNNKLVDNLYHSFVIKAVTEKLTGDGNPSDKESLAELRDIVFLEKYLDENFSQQYVFEYSGGGNSIIRFETKEDAIRFVKEYSFKVLEAYPDLELYISLIDEEKEGIAEQADKDGKIRRLLAQKADELKEKRRSRFKRWSYGVEVIDENGQAKQIKSDDRKKDTDEQRKKIIRKYLFEKFENALGNAVKVTEKLNDYKKEKDGKSYIGVIAIDGNHMGHIVNSIVSFEVLRNFSEAVEKTYFNAIVAALQEYRNKVEAEDLLLTPVLQSGDDICLIVEAEHAIAIAAGIIKKIAENSCDQQVLQKVIGSGYLTACGGVAIARYSYPFFEAVKIAESLCHRAKENIYLVKTMEEERQRKCFLHWEVVQSQVTTGIPYESYVKDRNIQVRFHIKPLCIDQTDLVHKDGIFSYEAFNRLVRAIQKEKKISSSLLENLKKQMYEGIEVYCLFLEINNQESKFLKNLIIDILSKNVDQYMTMVKKDVGQVIYILNDVLEALPFIAKLKEGSDGTGEKISN